MITVNTKQDEIAAITITPSHTVPAFTMDFIAKKQQKLEVMKNPYISV